MRTNFDLVSTDATTFELFLERLRLIPVGKLLFQGAHPRIL